MARSTPSLTVATAPTAASTAALASSLVAWLETAAVQYVGPGARAAMRAIVLALLCPVPTNVLLVGPPGVAKTSMIAAVARALAARFLDVTLSPWTQEADLYGAVDIKALADGRIVRALDPAKPTMLDAQLVHLDEYPRSTGGIRAMLMRALADRLMPNGEPVPAHVIVASANTRLTSEEDKASVDRYLLRVEVPRLLVPAEMRRVITRRVPVNGKAPTVAPLPSLDPSTLATLRAHAGDVDMPDDVADALAKLSIAMRQPAAKTAGAVSYPDVSERRWELMARMLQGAATLAGRSVIDWTDVTSVVPMCLDDGPESRASIDTAVKACVPAWVAQLAEVDTAIEQAIRRARVVGAVVDASPDDAHKHAKREETFDALLATLKPHGAHVVAKAEERIDAAREAIDDAYKAGADEYAARRRASK